ncbi:sugar ABC transporter permease [Caloranaerobacter ferrireducens]|uniref:sugar ABC transporter permease n=1 Tax=Caloranaerobacter ferrireducens TaxID=1323370 RepID=UPI00084D163B|nr:sugar ABC transporter permease [Caloranaerobacter ferrireducens]
MESVKYENSNIKPKLPNKRKNSSRKLIRYFLLYSLLLLIAFLVLSPVIWIVGSSFNPGTSIFSSTLIPKNPTVKHYIKLFTETDYPIWFMNTLKIATINMIVSLVITTLSAFAFSRFRFRGRKQGMMVILILQMFPSILAMTAIYALLTKLNLINTHMGLIIVYATGQIPFNTWLVKGYLDAIPRSLDEAAKIDGATNLAILTKIILPLAKPILVFVALQNFIGPWFDFIFPQLILRSADKKTLAMGLFAWIAERQQNHYTLFAAGAILVAVPITILYTYFQKHIVEGLSAGATKG